MTQKEKEQISDNELVRKIQQTMIDKNKFSLELEELLEEFYYRFKQYIFNTANNVLKNKNDALDIMQDIFLKLFKGKIKTFKFKSEFKTWLYQVTRNEALMHTRKTNRYRENELTTEIIRTDLTHSYTQKEATPKTLDLKQLIKIMPSGYRKILLLHDYCGFEHQEIGSMLNLGEGTSKSQLHKARTWMRHRMNVLRRVHLKQ